MSLKPEVLPMRSAQTPIITSHNIKVFGFDVISNPIEQYCPIEFENTTKADA